MFRYCYYHRVGTADPGLKSPTEIIRRLFAKGFGCLTLWLSISGVARDPRELKILLEALVTGHAAEAAAAHADALLMLCAECTLCEPVPLLDLSPTHASAPGLDPVAVAARGAVAVTASLCTSLGRAFAAPAPQGAQAYARATPAPRLTLSPGVSSPRRSGLGSIITNLAGTGTVPV
eukprot:gene1258-biopygen8893